MARGDISPPPVKRRKLALAEPSMPSGLAAELESKDAVTADSMSSPRTIRIFSWNINGVGPYLPAQSTKITSFFKPSDPSQPALQVKADGLRAFLSRHGWPEALFLQELKIQQGNTKALAALLASLNTPLNPNDTLTDSRTYTLDAVLPRDKHNARGFQGKLYGVGTILRTDFARSHVACVRPVDWDLEGRVSVVELLPPAAGPTQVLKDNTTTATQRNQNIEQGRPLALINIYAINGTASPYRSPTTGLVVGTRHDHKLAFHSLLRDECLRLEGRGFHVVVAGDVNVARGVLDGYPNLRTYPRQHCVNRADFNGKFFGVGDNLRAGAYVDGGGERRGEEKTEGEGEGEETGRCLDAVDVFRAMHGRERRYTYYPRTREWGTSCDRVDMVFMSRGLWEAGRVVGTGILNTPQERGLSDHVPIWVEIAVDGRNGRDGVAQT
jgi:exonuclease III